MLEKLLSLDHDGAALSTGDAEASYSELGRMAGAVRDALAEQGLGPGSLVALVLERDPAGIASMVGCLQAGACPLPLSPADPAPRLEQLLTMARPAALLVGGRGLRPVRDLLQQSAQLPRSLEVTEQGTLDQLEGGGGLSPAAVPEGAGLALLCCSPKARPSAVLHARATLDLLLTWAAEWLEAGAADRHLARCPLGQAGIILELMLPLATGGTACLTPLEPMPGPMTLPIFLERQRVTLAQVGAHLGPRMEGASRNISLPALRRLVLAGDPPQAGWLAPLLAAFPGATLNGLASSAALPVMAHQKLSRVPMRDPIPAGIPGPGLRASLIGRALRPAPRGEEGELWLSGPALPLSFLNAPDLDGQLFIHRAGSRYMRSRQRAYSDAADNLVLLGREDRQARVNGLLVDLAEVELCLRGCPGVTDAAVIALPHTREGNRLAALVRGDLDGEATLCMERCERRLSAEMVPDRIQVMERFPRTWTGAVDIVKAEMILSDE